MKKRNAKRRTRVISLLLCGTMLFSTGAASSLGKFVSLVSAEETTVTTGTPAVETTEKTSGGLCEHHTEHTSDCGYTAASPCSHKHTEDCYTSVTNCLHQHDASCYSDGVLPAEGEEKTSVCGHECTEESGCVKKELNCTHVHDENCGYSEGTPCGYVCEICAESEDENNAGNTENGENGETVTVEEIQALINALPFFVSLSGFIFFY